MHHFVEHCYSFVHLLSYQGLCGPNASTTRLSAKTTLAKRNETLCRAIEGQLSDAKTEKENDFGVAKIDGIDSVWFSFSHLSRLIICCVCMYFNYILYDISFLFIYLIIRLFDWLIGLISLNIFN